MRYMILALCLVLGACGGSGREDDIRTECTKKEQVYYPYEVVTVCSTLVR